MAVLVIAEHNHAALNPAVYSLVTAAQKIGGDIDIMITAQDGGKLAEEAAKINGIRRVLLSEAPYFAEELPENLGASVLEVAKEYDYFLFVANPAGKAAAPRVAAVLDVAQISEITQVVDAKTFKRPIYAGSVIETVRALDPKVVLTVRATAFDAAPTGEGKAELERVVPASPVIKVTFVRSEQVKSDRPDLQPRSFWRAAAVWSMKLNSLKWANWLTNSALRWVRPVRWSTPVLLRTIGRSVRPVRLLLRTCTSVSVFPVPFSILPASKTPKSLWL